MLIVCKTTATYGWLAVERALKMLSQNQIKLPHFKKAFLPSFGLVWVMSTTRWRYATSYTQVYRKFVGCLTPFRPAGVKFFIVKNTAVEVFYECRAKSKRRTNEAFDNTKTKLCFQGKHCFQFIRPILLQHSTESV